MNAEIITIGDEILIGQIVDTNSAWIGTQLNFAGIKSDLLPYVFDATKAKQGKYMPGSHIPILPPEKLHDTDFDYVLILPWNFYDDIRYQYDSLNIQKQVKFVKAIPELTFL